MELLIPLVFIGLVCGGIGVWFGGLRNRQTAGFWLGFFLGPFGWLLTLLLPSENAGQAPTSGSARTIPEQRGIGQCPTCGGGLVGLYAKCPHCASDVFWAGHVPMRTAQEAADEEERQEQLAAERQEQEKRLAAQRQRQQQEELERQREAQRHWEEQKRQAWRRWRERSRAVFVGTVSAARFVLRIVHDVLRALKRRRRESRARRALVSIMLEVRKADSVLRRWSNQLRTLDEAGKGRCLRMLLAILLTAVVATGTLAVAEVVEKYHESSLEQEKRDLAQRRRYDRLANSETRLTLLGFRTAFAPDFDWDKGIAEGTEAIRRKPQDAMPYRCRGYGRCVKGEWEPAIADFTEAIRLDSKDERSYDLRGCARCVSGEWELAIADFTEAVRRDPNYARAYAFRSVAYAHMGDVEKAQDDREHAKKLGLAPDELAHLAEVLE